MPKLPTESSAMPKQSSMIPPDSYELFFNDLKKRIGTARLKAALAVNQELILLYWQIGTEILAKQSEEGWGSKVIDQLAKDLKRSFPDMTGFSTRNLKYMRAFAEAWPDEQIVHQFGAQIPWKHNCVLLGPCIELEKFWPLSLKSLRSSAFTAEHLYLVLICCTWGNACKY